jgi:hypothetical protein
MPNERIRATRPSKSYYFSGTESGFESFSDSLRRTFSIREEPEGNSARRGDVPSDEEIIEVKNLNLKEKEKMTKVKDEITGELVSRECVAESNKALVINETSGEYLSEKCYTSFPNRVVNIIDINGKSYSVVSRQEAIKCGFIEGYRSGNFFTSKEAKKKYDTKKAPTRDYNAIRKFKEDDKKHNMKFGMWSPTDMITENKGYTFGVEIETASGIVPLHLYNELSLQAVYDGSIRDKNGNKVGKEYVTGVLQGDKGFMHLQKICNQLAKRTTVNRTCGIHAHIGNLNFSKEFIVYAYMLADLVMEDMFSMLPPSRLGNEYCHSLKKFNFDIKPNMSKEEYEIGIDEAYSDIFMHISRQYPSDRLNKYTIYDRHGAGGYSRNSPRYAWLNFLPAIFNIRDVRKFKDEEERAKWQSGDIYAGEVTSYTLEFRNHSASTNFKKIKNWVLICMAYCYYVENNKKAILEGKKISVEDMVRFAYPKTSGRLIEYIKERKEQFSSENAHDYEVEDYKKPRVTSVKDVTIKELVKR